MGWREDAVETIPGRQAGAGRFQMNVARARVIRVADEQIDVADHGRLVREIPHVGAEIIRLGRGVYSSEFDEPVRLCR